ncbi:MAG TPA: YceI family protein [Chitinophagaceae bacterium]
MKSMIAFSLLLVTAGVIATPAPLVAQAKYHVKTAAVKVSGTSSLHDWTEESTQATVQSTFMLGKANNITELSGLLFSMPVKSLKSEYKAMDNNTYKALNADKYPTITYAATSASVTAVNGTTFTIRSNGKLSIAGTTKDTEVIATLTMNADKSITVVGTKKFKMTDYGVKPPTAVFGTIKTGNEITVSFNIKLVPSA